MADHAENDTALTAAETAPVVPLARAAEVTEADAAVVENPLPIDLGADWHVHTDLGRGTASAVGMVDAAQAAGLHTVGITDQVSAATDWLPDYVEMVRAFARPGITVRCGVETAVLDRAGRLDLPGDVTGVDHVVVTAVHMPGAEGPVEVEEVRAALEQGTVTGEQIVDDLVAAMVAAVATSPTHTVLGRPFSLLPQLGLDDDLVTDDHLLAVAEACTEKGAAVEVDETWRAPSVRIAVALHDAGVTLVAGSDATAPRGVGAWRYLAALTGTSAAAGDERDATGTVAAGTDDLVTAAS
ncbi:PHP domain-containing protein [Jatrophihabitans sp. YIM 134969]